MMRLLSYSYAKQGQILFPYARRYENRRNYQAVPTIKPYVYYLNYKYPLIKLLNITCNSIKLIRLSDIDGYFFKLKMAQNEGKVNHPFYQRFLKVRIVLLEMQAKHKWASALKHGRQLFKQINHFYQDHKYSEIYEEGIINKMVQVFQEYYFMEKQKNIKSLCILLQRIWTQNNMLRKQIQTICQALNIKHNALENTQNLRDSQLILPPRRKILPQKLFYMINYPAQYNQSYNTVKPENFFNFLTDSFTNLTIQNMKKHADEYRPIIEREVKYFNNVMLTKLDYLISIEHCLSKGYYNLDLIDRVKTYISGYLKPKQHKSLSQERELCELLLLCNILQHVIRNFKHYDAINKKMIKMSKFMAYYDICLNKLATQLQNVSFESLQIILKSHYKILQRYLLVTFDNEKTLNRFKIIYCKLFGIMFDFSQNGILLVESAKDINFVYEVILSMYSIEDQERIWQILQKCENILMLNPILQEKQVANNYKALYLICLKYNFKSDIFASRLLVKIQWKVATIQVIGNYRQGTQMYDSDNLLANSFTYFLYLMVAETRNKEYEQVQQLWVEIFQKIQLQIDIKSDRTRDNAGDKQQKQGLYLVSTHRKHLPTKYSKISRLNQLLVMMSKMLDQGKHGELINRKFEYLCQIQAFQSLIRQYISYPNVFEHFNNIVNALKPEDSQIVQFIKSVYDVINQNVKNGNKTNQLQAINTYELINYQQFNDFLHIYAVFIDDFRIYQAKRFHYLAKLHPYLWQIVEKIPIEITVQQHLKQEIEQRGLELQDLKYKLSQILSTIQEVTPANGQPFFKGSKRQPLSRNQQRQKEKTQEYASIVKLRQASKSTSNIFAKKQPKKHDQQPKQTIQDQRQQQSTNLKDILDQISQCFTQLKALKNFTPFQAIEKHLQFQGPKMVLEDESSTPKPKSKKERRRSDILNKIELLKASKTAQ